MTSDANTGEPSHDRGALSSTRAASDDASPPELLVSEVELDAEDEEASGTLGQEIPADTQRQTTFEMLEQALRSQGLVVDKASDGNFLVIELPAGRSHRAVRISAVIAEEALTIDFSGWRSLERFDGIWNGQLGSVEVALRGERFSIPPSRMLSLLADRRPLQGGEVDDEALELVDEHSSVRMRIATASPTAAILLDSGRNYRPRPPVTLTISPVRLSTTADADALVEAATDSLSLQLGMRRGMLLTPRRLEDREIVRTRHRRAGGPISFPKSRYPHAPVTLYQAGRERTTSPLLRYWAFYQVLEYFFPRYSRVETLQRISQAVRSPTFDPHSDEDIMRLASISEGSAQRRGEEEQLILCLRAIVTADQVRSFILDCGLSERLAKKRDSLSSQPVNVDSEDLIAQLGRRVYDIRCRIVHSKSSSQREAGAGLLPGTSDDDLVRFELPLIDFLSEMALSASAERLDMRAFALVDGSGTLARATDVTSP